MTESSNHGPDSFTFTVADGQSESPPAVVEIFVNPVNDMPVVQAQSVSVNEDEPLPVHLAASDVEGDPLAYVVTPPARGTLAGTPPELVYRPFSNYHGPDSFTYRVSDGALTSAVATVSIMVLPVNDPPVADAKNLSLDEDTALLLTLTGTDLDGDALTFLTTLPAHGALAGVPPNLIYRPTTNYHGPDSFTFTVSDGRAISPPIVVAITVRPVNDPPTAPAQFVVVSEDTTLPLTLTGADVDGDALVFLVAPPGRGWLSGVAPNVVYHAPANYFGEDSFTFRASDGRATSAVATVQILILSVNDAPTADAQSLSVNEDTSLPITLTGADAEGDALMFLVSPPAHGTLAGAAPNLVYRPATNYHGPDSFTFTASDGLAESLPGTVTLTVVPVNDAPVADASATPRLKVISPNNTNAPVVLDGSRSFDVDHDALRCSWFETGATSPLATGLVVAVRLAVGAHPVQLRASDGVLWGTNTLTVTIITPGHAVGELIAQVNALGLTDKKKRPLVALLEQAGKEFGRRKFTDGVKHLGNFQQQVQAQLAPANPAGAAALIAGAQAIIDVFAGTGPRPRLQSVACSPGQAVKVRFAGTPGQIYLVQASSDLLRWETVGRVADGEAGDFEWVEPNPSAGACRFYRVVSP